MVGLQIQTKSYTLYILFYLTSDIKVIWYGFGIEFLENKDIGIFVHFIVIDFIKRYSYHTYFSPMTTSWFRRFRTGCIVRNGDWPVADPGFQKRGGGGAIFFFFFFFFAFQQEWGGG